MIPNLKDLVLYANKVITGADWNTNWRKLITWLTSGTADLKVNSLEISAEGELINNGNTQQNGNLDIGGTLTVAGNITTDGVITGDGSGITNLSSIALATYTPFAVNSGFMTDGKGDIITATPVVEGGDTVSFTIQFQVDNDVTYGKLEATSASGEHFALSSILSDSLAGNGTYFYFIKKGEAYTTKFKDIAIYRQPTAPTDLQDNIIWLDTSKEKLVCKKYNANDAIWESFDYVPLGKVVIANIGTASATATVTTFIFNWNGYNVNMGGCIDIAITEQPRVVVKTYSSGTNWYRIYNDGWVEQGGRGASANNWVTLFVAMKNTNYSAIAVNRETAAYEAVTTDRSDNAREKTRFYVGQSSHSAPFTWEVRGYGDF